MELNFSLSEPFRGAMLQGFRLEGMGVPHVDPSPIAAARGGNKVRRIRGRMKCVRGIPDAPILGCSLASKVQISASGMQGVGCLRHMACQGFVSGTRPGRTPHGTGQRNASASFGQS